jgi:solute carrier family 25 carnitine/acylcarnitine transporter 20/29
MSKLLILAATPNRKDSTLSTSEIAAAGFMSAIPTTLVAAPVERAKVLLQVQGQGKGSTHYKGVFDVLGHLYKEGGIKSVFRGSVATVIRDGPGCAALVPFSPPSVCRSCAYTDVIAHQLLCCL